MKPLNRFKYWIMTAVALPLIGIGCMEIVEIIHPEDAKVNSDIDISVKIKFTAETDHRSEIAFAILAPKAWNIRENASLTLTTEGYVNQGFAEVVDEAHQQYPLHVQPGAFAGEDGGQQGQPPRVFGGAFVPSGRGAGRAQDVFQPFGFAHELQVSFQFFHLRDSVSGP